MPIKLFPFFNMHDIIMSLCVLQALAEEKLGYELRNTLHVKTWEYNGTQPFSMADESYYLKAYILKL